MSFEQVYYTSCTSGLGGSKGFQINAASPGLDPATLQQVERVGGYVPPLSAPTRPTAEELEAFPIALLYQRIPGGALLVAQARYVGADYSGRYGNYFTHSLVTRDPDTDLKDLLPIQLWRSPVWTTVESPTPVIGPLAAAAPGGAVGPAEVQAFLACEGRLARLPAFITAVQQALASKRRIIIADDGDGVALWIAAACHALPRHLVLDLTFTTYAKNPYQTDALLVGTTSDSDFGFAQHEIEHQFSVFDFASGRFTPCPAPSPFATGVARAYETGHLDHFAGFLRFVAQVAPALPVADLGAAFAAHALLAGQPPADLAGVARWCARHADRLSRAQLAALFAALTSGGADSARLEAARTLYAATAQPGSAHDGAVDAAFAEWVVQAAAVKAPAEELLRLGEAGFSPGVLAAAAPLRKVWIEQTTAAATDAARVSALLRLGEALGFLREGGERLRRVGERAVGPNLSDAGIRAALSRLCASAAGADLVSGVVTWLLPRVADDAAFAVVTALRDDKALMGALTDAAKAEGLVPLQMRLIALGVQGRRELRAKAYLDCLAAIPASAQAVEVTYADTAFKLLWIGDDPLTLSEGVAIVEALRGRDIAGTQVRAALVRALLHGVDLGQRDAVRARLAEALAALGSKRAAALCESYQWVERLRAREGVTPALLAEVVRAAQGYGHRLAAALTVEVARRLLEFEDPGEHARGYQDCAAAAPAEFQSAYAAQLPEVLGDGRAGPRTAPVRLLRAWEALPAAPRRALVDERLPALLRDWPDRALDAVEKDLAANPPELDRFKAWRERHRPARGLLDRFKAWSRSS
jgi:hypothetical protein